MLVVLTRKGKLLFKPIILVIMPFGLHSNRIMKVSMPMRWGFAVSWPIPPYFYTVGITLSHKDEEFVVRKSYEVMAYFKRAPVRQGDLPRAYA